MGRCRGNGGELAGGETEMGTLVTEAQRTWRGRGVGDKAAVGSLGVPSKTLSARLRVWSLSQEHQK